MLSKGRNSTVRRARVGVLAVVGAALAGVSLPAAAAEGPSLGSARSFGVLGASTVTSTGLTAVTGDVGVSPGTEITGFPPGIVTGGAIHAGDAVAAQAHSDASIAYAFLEGMASIPANNLSDTDLGGRTLPPGVYKFNSSAQLTGDLVLDAQGDPGALFVVQIASTLTTASGSTVKVIRGGASYDKSQVYWQVGSSATLGSGTAFTGNILAFASITLVTGSSLVGNALALNGAVTMESNSVVTSPRRQPSKGTSTMISPVGAPVTDASVRINVKHFPPKGARLERSWFKGKAKRLEASTDYTLWADDPSTPGAELVQFGAFTTKSNGKFNVKMDTRNGDALPFGATLASLSGASIEVRDAAGTTTVLAGTIPTTNP